MIFNDKTYFIEDNFSVYEIKFYIYVNMSIKQITVEFSSLINNNKIFKLS